MFLFSRKGNMLTARLIWKVIRRYKVVGKQNFQGILVVKRRVFARNKGFRKESNPF
jgi:hypothetical protein